MYCFFKILFVCIDRETDVYSLSVCVCIGGIYTQCPTQKPYLSSWYVDVKQI